jgi:chemotaxis protein methyltransferase CheR
VTRPRSFEREDQPDDGELRAFLDQLHDRHGYDFRRYVTGGLRRRLGELASRIDARTLDELLAWASRDRDTLHTLVDALTIRVTGLFRDPELYAAFRRDVVPFLRTYPTLKAWVAGCASGEEAHSLAMVLAEEGLLDRARIYATDVSASAVARARAGIYAAGDILDASARYLEAGGKRGLRHYVTIAHGHAAIDRRLARAIHFAEHNLVSDDVFGEMHVVFCRNVLIYFERDLQHACLSLLERTLAYGGFLCLGREESLSHGAAAFDELVPRSRIFRKRLDAACL